MDVWICKGCQFDIKECDCGWLKKLNWSRKEDTLRLSETDARFLSSMRIVYGTKPSDYAKSV